MKHVIYVFFIMPLFLAFGCKEQVKEEKMEQETSPVVLTEHSSEDVAETVSKLYRAMVDRNRPELEKLCHSQLTYGHSTGTIEDKKAFIDEVADGQHDYLSISPEDQSIYISGNTAVVRHFFVSEGQENDQTVKIRLGCMQIYQNTNGNWILLARQAYKL